MHRLNRLQERLQHFLTPLELECAPDGRVTHRGRRLLTIRARRRRDALRLELASDWPWPARRHLDRGARGPVWWVSDERSLRAAVELVRRALERAGRRRRRGCNRSVRA